MIYTEKNLRKCLEKIDPVTYNNLARFAKMNIPELLDHMFVIGFKRTLMSRGRFFENFLNDEEIDVLFRGYNDLYGNPGYLKFDEE